jgi:chromosome segregation ATPase
MVSVKEMKEELVALGEKASASEQELVALRTACEDYKVDVEAKSAELMEAKADLEGQAVAHAEALEEVKDEMEAKDEQLVDANESLEQMKANMELSPVADVIEGAEPVADGSVAGEGEAVDHVAEMNKLEDSAERIAYYRANKEIIDKA